MADTIDGMPRKRKPPTVSVRVSKDLAHKLRIVIASKGKDTSDYLGEILEPILAKELDALGRTLTGAEPPQKKRPKV